MGEMAFVGGGVLCLGVGLRGEGPEKAIMCSRPSVCAASMLPVSGCMCLGRSE